MTLTEICISFIVAIIGIGYPIILQVITDLDEKYGADIASLFKAENVYDWFKHFLYTTLIITFLYVVVLVMPPFLNEYQSLLIFIAKGLLFISTTLLVLFFFRMVHKILKYYSPIELSRYLIDKDQKAQTRDDFTYFIALKSILMHVVKKQDDNIPRTITDHLYSCFNLYRQNHPNDEKGYPDAYYKMVYDLAQELLLLEKNRLKYIEHRAVCGIWLMGEFTENKISERTYSYLWLILRLAIENNREDLVVAFWEHSDQYFQFSLRQPEIIYSADYKVMNQNEIDERKTEQERFIQFHYALGGLLMYQKQYVCIRRFFRYTSSEPPVYNLLPSHMTEIFTRYIFYRDWYERNIPFIASIYSFPNMEGVKAGGMVRNWICKYIGILFLRQYTLLRYYTFQEFFALPAFPETLGKKKIWLENLDYFKTLIRQLLADKESMKELGFDLYEYLSDEWCIKNSKPKPLDLIDQIEEALRNSIDQTQQNQEPDPEKIQLFKDTTKSMVSAVIDEYRIISNKVEPSGHKQSWFVSGTRYLFDKEAFCKNQGVDNLNAHSFNAEVFVSNFRKAISETFFYNKSKTYLLPASDIQSGLSRLNLNKNEHIIISFGISTYQLEQIGGFKDGQFGQIQYVPYQNCNYELMGESFFILRKNDLPRIKFNAIDAEKTKYKLDLLDGDINLSANIIDLNKEDEIRKEFEDSNKDKDLNKFVLAYLGISIEIQWKSNINMIQIRLDSPYDQRGLTNKLDEIEPINPSKKSK